MNNGKIERRGRGRWVGSGVVVFSGCDCVKGFDWMICGAEVVVF